MSEQRPSSATHRFFSRAISLFVTIAVALSGLYGFHLYDTWNNMRTESMQAQSRIEHIIKHRNISGFARALYYFKRVDFVGEGFGKEEILEMKDVCKDYDWINSIKISESSISADDLAEIRKEFAPIIVWTREESM